MPLNRATHKVVLNALDSDRLKRRADGRKQAKAILELVTLDHVDKIEAFLDELRSTLQPAEVLDEVVGESRKLSALAAIRLPRGKHEGERLDEVPREYLDWWIRDGEELTARIGEYLAATEHLSEKIQTGSKRPFRSGTKGNPVKSLDQAIEGARATNDRQWRILRNMVGPVRCEYCGGESGQKTCNGCGAPWKGPKLPAATTNHQR